MKYALICKLRTDIIILKRRITLWSVVLKVFKRIVEKGMREILGEQLKESGNDFRKRKSCQDHMFILKQISGSIRMCVCKNRNELKYNLMLRKEALKKRNMDIIWRK